MKCLLITGADGFTGQHLCRAAEKTGYKVVPFCSDLTDENAVASEVASICPTQVIHLAAISAVTHEDQEAIYKVNLFGSLNLLKAISSLPKKPERVLLASSANVYGNTNTELISEAICPQPINHYAMSKLAMEHMAKIYLPSLPLIFTRPFNYTGIGHDTRFVIPKIIEHIKNNVSFIELGNLDVYREYNDVRMVCDAYLQLLEKGVVGEIYNICSGRAYSLREVLATTEKISGRVMELKVNNAFVRLNEVHTLAGDPKKLTSTIGKLLPYDLHDTLSWMLEAT